MASVKWPDDLKHATVQEGIGHTLVGLVFTLNFILLHL